MEERQIPHSFIMQERNNAVLTGILDVDSFSDDCIVLRTVMGKLTIKGEGLHISRFSAETGDLEFDGTFGGMVYTTDGKNKSLKGRLLR